MKKLMDISLRMNIPTGKKKLRGRFLLNDDGTFEGVLNTRRKMDYQLIVGNYEKDGDYSIIDFVLCREKGDPRFPIRILAEQINKFEYTGEICIQTDASTSLYGTCEIGIHAGEVIREVTDKEIEQVSKLSDSEKNNIGEESSRQLKKVYPRNRL